MDIREEGEEKVEKEDEKQTKSTPHYLLHFVHHLCGLV